MARYSRVGAGPRIFVLILLLAVLLAGGTLWFDYLGIIDAKAVLQPLFRLIGVASPTPVPQAEPQLLLDSARLAKREEALQSRAAELEQQKAELDKLQNELQKRQEELDSRQAALDDKEKSFNQRVQQYENRREVLIQNSRDLRNMRPQQAIAILKGYDDQLLIDTLRVTEELAQQAGEFSVVPVWLSGLPPDRAAEIQRKMTIKPGQQN